MSARIAAIMRRMSAFPQFLALVAALAAGLAAGWLGDAAGWPARMRPLVDMVAVAVLAALAWRFGQRPPPR